VAPSALHQTITSPACSALPCQVVFDINGREAEEAEPILESLGGRGGSMEQYIYCSSAGED
jgi:hypothetical protein